MVKLKGFQKLTSTEVALQKWFKELQVEKPKQVKIPLGNALGRVLAEDIIAESSLPRFDKSAMDGYAVRFEDSVGASQFRPAVLKLTEANDVKPVEARQIWTGQPIPKGANAVIMIENTQKKNDKLEIWSQLSPNENVAKQGEDVNKGHMVAKGGTRLNPYHIALAAALGYSSVEVYVKPKVAILSTGNEIVEVGAKLAENQIFNSNKIMLSAMCQELGAEILDYGIVEDNLDKIKSKIKDALQEADTLITTGGTSVGGLDFVPDAINSVGKPGVIAHGLLLRPAMPTGVAVLEGKPVMILSGNPVAAVIGFEVFGRPMISKLLGLTKTEPRPILKAVMSRKVPTALGRKTYVRVLVKMKKGELVADPVSAKGPGAISTMTMSNGFVIVPENREGLVEGEAVIVHMFAEVGIEE